MKFKLVFVGLLLLLLTGCADAVSFTEAANMSPVGFFYGLWHGMICGFAFVVSLFSNDTAIYAIYNNGGWYDFGFCIGVGAFVSGSSSARRR